MHNNVNREFVGRCSRRYHRSHTCLDSSRWLHKCSHRLKPLLGIFFSCSPHHCVGFLFGCIPPTSPSASSASASFIIAYCYHCSSSSLLIVIIANCHRCVITVSSFCSLSSLIVITCHRRSTDHLQLFVHLRCLLCRCGTLTRERRSIAVACPRCWW